MTWIGVAVGAGLLLCLAGVVYLTVYLRWEAGETGGNAYYRRPLAERRSLKRRMRWYSLPALPMVHLFAALSRQRATMPTFEFEGVSGPPRVSSPEIFGRARAYAPRPEDIFVVTQMRCGTTWMQQIVHEIVTRGQGSWRQGRPSLRHEPLDRCGQQRVARGGAARWRSRRPASSSAICRPSCARTAAARSTSTSPGTRSAVSPASSISIARCSARCFHRSRPWRIGSAATRCTGGRGPSTLRDGGAGPSSATMSSSCTSKK